VSIITKDHKLITLCYCCLALYTGTFNDNTGAGTVIYGEDAGGFIYSSFYNEIITISSIKEINDIPVYEMNYRGEYAFDKYLTTGSKSYNEYNDLFTDYRCDNIFCNF